MAEIWLARQKGPADFSRCLVIKRIHAHLNDDAEHVGMFLDEARTNVQLNHANIAQVYDFGEVAGRYYMAMEHVLGENLAAISWRAVKRNRPLPVELAARIVADACAGLDHAHRQTSAEGRPLRIVHRDVSPQNILVSYDGATKLVDFGIAKSADQSNETRTNVLKGKISYMSPEQCLHGAIDRRSDVFATGIVLYELLTAKRLFRHEAELVVLQMITTRTPVPPSAVNPAIPPALDAVVMRALAKDPADRFQSAAEMKAAIEACLPAGSASRQRRELSRYMRTQFADAIEKKRTMLERASAANVEPPPPPPPAPTYDPRVVIPPPHATGSPGMVPPPPGFYEAIRRGEIVPHPATGTPVVFVERPPQSSWVPRLVTALALVVIVMAGGVLAHQLTRDPVKPPPPPPPVEAPMLGTLPVSTDPSGARILIDGKPLLVDGVPAKTPQKIVNLRYGTPYAITFQRDGFEKKTVHVVMGEPSDGKLVRQKLEPILGRLHVKVATGQKAQIFVDGEAIGTGRIKTRSLPVGREYRITASYRRLTCVATPETVTVEADALAQVVVRCKKRRGRTRREATTKTTTGCVTDSDQPPGRVHITSKPFAEMYYRGERIGSTPAANLRLPAGCVELELRTADGATHVRRIEVLPRVISKHRLEL